MKLLQFFQEDNGNFSNARLLAFFTVSSFIIDWQTHIWKSIEFTPSWTIVGFTLGVVGLKVVQKLSESENPKFSSFSNSDLLYESKTGEKK